MNLGFFHNNENTNHSEENLVTQESLCHNQCHNGNCTNNCCNTNCHPPIPIIFPAYEALLTFNSSTTPINFNLQNTAPTSITYLVGQDIISSSKTIINDTITLANIADTACAVILPRAGQITDLNVLFTVASACTLTGNDTITLTAQLYYSSMTNNTFTSLSPAVTLTPTLPTNITAQTICLGTLHHLNLPVTADTRLILAVTACLNGNQTTTVTLSGCINASLVICG